MTPRTPTPRQLEALRSWRTWLLALGALVQGVQYVTRPSVPLSTPAYVELVSWGPGGWRLFGGLLMAVGAWLSLVHTEWALLGHAAGVIIYAALVVASFEGHVIPAVLLVILGLHGGEVAVWVRGQTRRPRSRSGGA